jgi:hypothetical protein
MGQARQIGPIIKLSRSPFKAGTGRSGSASTLTKSCSDSATRRRVSRSCAKLR